MTPKPRHSDYDHKASDCDTDIIGHPHEPMHFHDEPKARDLSRQKRMLGYSFLIITSFMLIEVIGGLLTHSLALLSDAGHMLSDAAALGATLLAFKIGERAANRAKTYGYKRFEILVAGANGATLIIIAVMIVLEAIERFQSPPDIASNGMLIIAGIGLMVNLLVAWLLHRGGGHAHVGHVHSHEQHHDHDHEHSHTGESAEKNLNMHSAYLHVLGDLLGSVAAIVAALLMIAFGWTWADPVASIIVALLILISGYRVVKASSHILMEGTPSEISIVEVRQTIKAHDDVLDIHDLHVWSITSGLLALSCHVIVSADMRINEASKIIHELDSSLKDLGISHSTIQLESKDYFQQHAGSLTCEL